MKSKLNVVMLSAVALAFCSIPASAAVGAVYTLNNSSSGNAVLMFNRSSNGYLALGGTFATGGLGSGAGLGSQGAVILDASNRFLFAVNAGSNTISVFSVTVNGLSLIGTTSSAGQNPISLTSFGNLLYVLDDGGAAGGNDTIAGFTVDANGHLQNISQGTLLSAPYVGPAEISFNPEGNLLIVTEKNTNNIDVFSLDVNGVASGPNVIASAGETPYGFAFGRRDNLIVSDAVGGTANAGAVSSYFLAEDQTHHTVSASVADKQSAPCWIAATNDGRFAYTTNTGSGTVSAYSVGYAGKLGLLNANGIAASLGGSSAPIDLAISNDSGFLYVLGPGTGIVDGFKIESNGALTTLQGSVGGVPASASGLAVR
ncbi:MAG: beta-propeller fold lactonase family protein [Candidatus Sulfotelmatobacter sp.]